MSSSTGASLTPPTKRKERERAPPKAWQHWYNYAVVDEVASDEDFQADSGDDLTSVSDKESEHETHPADVPGHAPQKHSERAPTPLTFGKVMCNGTEYTIPTARLAKARKHLNSEDAARVLLMPKACRCPRQCKTKFTLQNIVETRAKFYCNTTCESTSTEWLAQQLREYGNDSPCPQGSTLKYKVTGIEVCGEFWRRVYALGAEKPQAARNMVYSGNRLFDAHVNRHPRPQSKTHYNFAVAFWQCFFKAYCQTPYEGLRLFPHDMTYQSIYEVQLQEYRQTIMQANPGFVVPHLKKSTFYKARRDDQFADVKRRVKHRHCQCPTCASLAASAKHGFASEYARHAHRERRGIHNRNVVAWRVLETDVQMRGRHSPSQNLVLFYDDTS